MAPANDAERLRAADAAVWAVSWADLIKASVLCKEQELTANDWEKK